MKAISLKQPWASLVVIGAKRIETRSWNTKHRGPLVIHASVKKLTKDEIFYYTMHTEFARFLKTYEPELPLTMNINALPYGEVIGRVDVIDTHPTDRITEFFQDIWDEKDFSEIQGKYPQSLTDHRNWPTQEKAFGDFSEGRYGWLLKNAVEFQTPVPYKGGLSLWEFPDELIPSK